MSQFGGRTKANKAELMPPRPVLGWAPRAALPVIAVSPLTRMTAWRMIALLCARDSKHSLNLTGVSKQGFSSAFWWVSVLFCFVFCRPLPTSQPRSELCALLNLCGADDYISRTYYNLLWPPSLWLFSLAGWLLQTSAIWTHSTQFISFFPISQLTPFLSDRCPGLTPFPATEISALLSCYANPFFKTLLKTILPRRLPQVQPSGLLSKFPWHLCSQPYTLASKCFCTFFQM